MKTLKYIFIPLIILLVFGCSITPSFDGFWSGPSSSSKTYFSPPNWIQGDWFNEANIYDGFKFKFNDVIIDYDYTNRTGYSLNIGINIHPEYLSATEQISSSEYHITILHPSDNTTDYNFTKVSENEINCHIKEIFWGEETILDCSLIRVDYSLTRR